MSKKYLQLTKEQHLSRRDKIIPVAAPGAVSSTFKLALHVKK